MTRWHLARRDLLKKLGVGLGCLPVLRATRSYAQAGVAKPKHLMVLQMSEGYRQQYWKPATGPLTTLPPTLMPLEAFKNELITVPDLGNPGAGGSGHSTYGVIAYGRGSTGGGYKEPSGPTFDQYAVNGLSKTPRKSLNLWIQMHLPPLPTTQPGGRHCYWINQGQPINPQGDPYAVYKEIFAGGDFNTMADPAAVKRLMTNKKSILDFVGANLEDFKKRLGPEDRTGVEAHLQAIRDLEGQLQAAGSAGAGGCASAGPNMIDINDRAQYPNIQKANYALMISALKCGVTNVVTNQHGDSSGNSINFGAYVPGLPALSKNNYKSPWRNWHDLGHSPIQDGTDHKKIVDTWFMARFAELFTQMKAVPAEGGTLFDNTVIVIHNHMQDGSNHDGQKNPLMVLAGKNGGLKTGQCVNGAGKNVGDVYHDVLAALGVMHPYTGGLGLTKA